jgi:hypothetical protein
MPQLTFVNDSFHVGVFTIYVRHGDKASKSDTIKPWSLCEIHARLRERYWPPQESLDEAM